MNFIQLLSGITQALKAKAGWKRTFITRRSITSSSNLSDLPFYRGKLSINFGRISTNAQMIGSCVLQVCFPGNCTWTFAAFGKKQFGRKQKHRPDRPQHTFQTRRLKKHLRFSWFFCHLHTLSKAVTSPLQLFITIRQLSNSPVRNLLPPASTHNNRMPKDPQLGMQM